MSTKTKNPKKGAQDAGKVTAAPIQEGAQNDVKADAAVEEKKAAVALFGQIGFETIDQFNEFTNSMKQNNYNNILLTVNLSLRSVQQRGGFSLEESEAVSIALRHLNGAFSAVPAEGEATTEATEGK